MPLPEGNDGLEGSSIVMLLEGFVFPNRSGYDNSGRLRQNPEDNRQEGEWEKTPQGSRFAAPPNKRGAATACSGGGRLQGSNPRHCCGWAGVSQRLSDGTPLPSAPNGPPFVGATSAERVYLFRTEWSHAQHVPRSIFHNVEYAS